MTESIIPVTDLQRFGEDCLVAVGCGREHAAAHIAVLVEADKRGHYSHGFNRLRGHYVADIRSKVRRHWHYTHSRNIQHLISTYTDYIMYEY